MSSSTGARTTRRLGAVSEVRVRVAYDAPRGGPAREVCLLDVPVGAAVAADLDERLLDAITPLLDGAPVHYTVHLGRCWTNRGSVRAHLELHVELSNGDADSHRELVAAAFGAVLKECGRPDRPDLHRDEALTRARVRAAQAFPHLHAESLAVVDEEHHEGWEFGLVTPDRDRYAVLVGFVDGFVGSAQVRHRPRLEVIDSIGP